GRGARACVRVLARAAGRPVGRGAGAPAPAADPDPPMAPDADGLRRFDPARLQVFGRDASWVLLWPGEGDWPQAPFVLEIEGAGLQALTLHGPDPGIVRTTQSTRGEQAWPAHGHLAFAIAEAPAPGEALRLRIDASGVAATPISFALWPTVEYLRADARWLALASACLGILGAMLLVAVFFAVRLRAHSVARYAGFVL